MGGDGSKATATGALRGASGSEDPLGRPRTPGESSGGGVSGREASGSIEGSPEVDLGGQGSRLGDEMMKLGGGSEGSKEAGDVAAAASALVRAGLMGEPRDAAGCPDWDWAMLVHLLPLKQV